MSDSPTIDSPIEQLQAQALESTVIDVIRTCYDPESK
jgi:hypothetical protein